MTCAIELLALAEKDVEAAKQWYRRCHPHLEADLILCVDETLARMARQPLSFPRVKGEFRHAFVHRFPYRIVFRLRSDLLVVVAVLHTRRDPRTWIPRDMKSLVSADDL
jgi:toxin ParE1/3/4